MAQGLQREFLSAQVSLAAVNLGATAPAQTSPTRPPPAIPDHDLLRCIGRGSYGEVWLARNIMGTYRAVKIVYRATFDSDRPYEREFKGLQKFEPISRTHESQVAVLHVGRNDREGYFFHVMELADDQRSGQQIDPGRYAPRTLSCELKAGVRLPPEQCLRIGLALTTALDHLHQHGLIHRDIKPSNIIYVNGQPKLADIGLVAMVDATCTFVGTEGYLPPEGPGTPQADLYSLGKVLYEASTGKDRRDFPELPSQLDSLQQGKGILELNAVVLKACKPIAQQRYESARQMHDDLLLLVAGKSVRQTHALERRLKLATRVGLALFAILVLGAVPYYVAIKEAWLAAANERKARTEAAKSAAVAQFLQDMLEGIDPSVALGRDTTLLREIMDKTAKRVGSELTNEPAVEAELRNTIGEVWFALGQYEKAAAMHRQALATRSSLSGGEDADVAESLHNLAKALLALGKPGEAEHAQRRALALRQKLFGNDNAEVASSFSGLGRILFSQGRRTESEAAFRGALSTRKKLFGSGHPSLAASLNDLASVLFTQGRLAEAEDALRDAVALAKKVADDQHAGDLAQALYALAWVFQTEDKLPDAENAAREALDIRQRIEQPGRQGQDMADSLYELAVVLQSEHKSDEAETPARQCLARYERMIPNEWPTINCRSTLGLILLSERKYPEAEPLLLSAYEGLSQVHRTFAIDMKARVREVLERLVALYEAMPRPTETAQWKLKLAEFNQSQSANQPQSSAERLQASAPLSGRSR